MSKSTKRVWLRLAPDNPILSVPSAERSKIAEYWLRLGCEIDRLERAIDRLEQLEFTGQVAKKPKPIEANLDQSAKKSVLACFEEL